MVALRIARCLCYASNMAAIHIRDVPREIVDTLKQRAARHHRSLQGELRSILEEVAHQEPRSRKLPPLKLELATGPANANWSREEIYGDDGR